MPISPAPAFVLKESFATPSLVETSDNAMSPPILVNRESQNPSSSIVTAEAIGFPSLDSIQEPRTKSPFQLSPRTVHRSRDSAYGFDFLL